MTGNPIEPRLVRECSPEACEDRRLPPADGTSTASPAAPPSCGKDELTASKEDWPSSISMRDGAGGRLEDAIFKPADSSNNCAYTAGAALAIPLSKKQFEEIRVEKSTDFHLQISSVAEAQAVVNLDRSQHSDVASSTPLSPKVIQEWACTTKAVPVVTMMLSGEATSAVVRKPSAAPSAGLSRRWQRTFSADSRRQPPAASSSGPGLQQQPPQRSASMQTAVMSSKPQHEGHQQLSTSTNTQGDDAFQWLQTPFSAGLVVEDDNETSMAHMEREPDERLLEQSTTEGCLAALVRRYSNPFRHMKFADQAVSLPQQLMVVIIVSSFILYPSLCQVALSIFSCKKLDRASDAFSENQQATWPHGYWTRNMQQECYTGLHLRLYVPIGIVSVLLFCLIPPFTYFMLTWHCQPKLENPEIKIKYGFLYQQHKPRYFWWASIRQLQVLAMVAVEVFGRALPVGDGYILGCGSISI